MKFLIDSLLKLLLLIFLSLVLINKYIFSQAFGLYIVKSGSMSPKISMGSLIVVIPRKTYSLNDVIAFRSPVSGEVISHRIIVLSHKDTDVYITTKGDANNENDLWELTESSVLGKIIVTIPYIGSFITFMRAPWGLTFFIYIPAVILFFMEFKTLIVRTKNPSSST